MTSKQRDALAARARRAALIRRRVVAATLATFALAWGVIAFHGAMAAEATTTASQQAATTGSATSDSGTSSSSSSDQSGAVTTAQS